EAQDPRRHDVPRRARCPADLGVRGSYGGGTVNYRDPSHYRDNKIAGRECIEITHHMTFSAGNVAKYLWRAGFKAGESAQKDLDKALRYLEFLIDQHQPAWAYARVP